MGMKNLILRLNTYAPPPRAHAPVPVTGPRGVPLRTAKSEAAQVAWMKQHPFCDVSDLQSGLLARSSMPLIPLYVATKKRGGGGGIGVLGARGSWKPVRKVCLCNTSFMFGPLNQ